MDKDVQQAGQLLITRAFCRELCDKLDACLEDAKTRQPDAKACKAEGAAFMACDEQNKTKAVQTLVQIAGQHCPTEIEAFMQCKAQTAGGSPCEKEDLAAMRCASRVVLEVNRQERAASR